MWPNHTDSTASATSPRKHKRSKRVGGKDPVPCRIEESVASVVNHTILQSQWQGRLWHQTESVEYRVGPGTTCLSFPLTGALSMAHATPTPETAPDAEHHSSSRHKLHKAKAKTLCAARTAASTTSAAEPGAGVDATRQKENQSFKLVRFGATHEQWIHDTLGRFVGRCLGGLVTIKGEGVGDEQIPDRHESKATSQKTARTSRIPKPRTRSDRIVRFRLPGDEAVYDTGGRVVG